MIKKFKKHLENNFSFINGKKILIGISGGLDSMVLTSLLKELDFDIVLAHVNFKLRAKDSEEDESFVMQWAQANKLAIFKTSFDTIKVAKERKVSIEMAARDLRYDWFNNLVNDNNFEYIAVAHHLNDNIETVFMNLTRGTGISGISGMKNISGNIIRPLLPFSRKEIEAYAKENEILWREDLSNLDTVYKRNKIRHELVPLLEELNPSFLKSFSKNISNFKQTELIQDNYLNTLDYSFWIEKENNIEISISELKKLIAYETILREKLLPYNFRNIDDILSGLTANSGKEYLSDTHRIIKDRDRLILEEIHENLDNEIIIDEKTIQFFSPLHILFNTTEEFNENLNLNLAQLDKEKLSFPLKLRKWKTGDFFYPQGMKGKKKLSKYYKDEKYSLADKENQWLLVSGENIVWILGKRIDDRYKVTENTKQIYTVLI